MPDCDHKNGFEDRHGFIWCPDCGKTFMSPDKRLRDAAPDLASALEPFAIDFPEDASDGFVIEIAITVGDLRRARSALLKAKGERNV